MLSHDLLDPLLLGLWQAENSQPKEVIHQMAAMEGEGEIDTVGTGRGEVETKSQRDPQLVLLTASTTAAD